VGVPVYALVWIGMVAIVIGLIKKRKGPEEGILVLLGFLCFFVAHSLFWYLGIFNSMGLKRVLLGVMPLMAIMALNGFNIIAEGLAKRPQLKAAVIVLLLTYIVIFPFTANPSAIRWKKDLMMTEEQKMAFRLKDTVLKLGAISGPMIYDHQYLSLVFGLDHFDAGKRLSLTPDHIQALKPGGIVIWENQFAEEKSGLKKEQLDADSRLTRLYTREIDDFGKRIEYAVYIKN
jgi:4-amino-4-deoxy-L-arabinose transferase-like glycosyltransferase